MVEINTFLDRDVSLTSTVNDLFNNTETVCTIKQLFLPPLSRVVQDSVLKPYFMVAINRRSLLKQVN